MINLIKNGIVLTKTSIGFENVGVLNPAVIIHESEIHVFYRAVAKGNYSTIGHCKLDENLQAYDRSVIPVIFPQFDYEKHGVEDPRIVKIDTLFYLTYTAYDGLNALGALATSIDLQNFVKHGIIVPMFSHDEFMHLAKSSEIISEKYHRYNNYGILNEHSNVKVFVWDKNLIFFPRRIKGKLVFIHRIKPDIQIVFINELNELNELFWANYIMKLNDNILLKSIYDHEVSYIGGGCPPIETSEGWILIYHGVRDTINGYVYSACVSLLELENPCIEIARLNVPLFEPDFLWEQIGEVNNVCFPTGAIVMNGMLSIFYGAADEQIACSTLKLSDLLTELKQNRI